MSQICIRKTRVIYAKYTQPCKDTKETISTYTHTPSRLITRTERCRTPCDILIPAECIGKLCKKQKEQVEYHRN